MHRADLRRAFTSVGHLNRVLRARFVGVPSTTSLLNIIHDLGHWRVRRAPWALLETFERWDHVVGEVMEMLDVVEGCGDVKAGAYIRATDVEAWGRRRLLHEEAQTLALEFIVDDVLGVGFYSEENIFAVADAFEDLEGMDSMQVDAMVEHAKTRPILRQLGAGIAQRIVQWKVYG